MEPYLIVTGLPKVVAFQINRKGISVYEGSHPSGLP